MKCVIYHLTHKNAMKLLSLKQLQKNNVESVQAYVLLLVIISLKIFQCAVFLIYDIYQFLDFSLQTVLARHYSDSHLQSGTSLEYRIQTQRNRLREVRCIFHLQTHIRSQDTQEVPTMKATVHKTHTLSLEA